MRAYHLHEKGSGYIVSGLSDGRTVEVREDNGTWSTAESPERTYDSPDELLEDLEPRKARSMMPGGIDRIIRQVIIMLAVFVAMFFGGFFAWRHEHRKVEALKQQLRDRGQQP